jgi:hypothetical protein
MTNRKILAALGAVLLVLVAFVSVVAANPASSGACDCKSCGDRCECLSPDACRAGADKACDCSQCGNDCSCASAGACNSACDGNCQCDCGDSCNCAGGCQCGCNCKKKDGASSNT